MKNNDSSIKDDGKNKTAQGQVNTNSGSTDSKVRSETTQTREQGGTSETTQTPDQKRIDELEEKVRMLALTIDTVEDEKLVVEEKLKKALADYHNLERNNERRNELRLIQLKKDLASSLINLMDDIYYGLNAREKLEVPENVTSWVDGLVASMSKMSNVLSELGISLMEVTTGDEFDSNKHEAIAMTKGGKKGSIIEVVQPGYIMDDQVIRPAKVVVSN